MLEFKIDVSNGIYEVNVGMSLKNLKNVKLCTLLDVLTLNYDYKMNSIHFI